MKAILRWIALAGIVLCAGVGGLPQSAPRNPAPAAENRVDINHASIDDLLKVPGMTRVWAGRIIRYRPYRAKNELVDHGIVTPAVYDRIKDYVIAHSEKQ
jgi:DNA uptake protein ComE-like DNA-binding protein